MKLIGGIKTRLKIDILSDTHFDNYFYGKYTNYDVINFYSQIIDQMCSFALK